MNHEYSQFDVLSNPEVQGAPTPANPWLKYGVATGGAALIVAGGILLYRKFKLKKAAKVTKLVEVKDTVAATE